MQVPCSLGTVSSVRIKNNSQVHTRSILCKFRSFSKLTYSATLLHKQHQVICYRTSIMACVASPGLQELTLDESPFKDFTVAANTCSDGEMKLRVDVTGAKTQAVFDGVFSKLVDAAQPIPGFRRVKGGKTPDIPKDILMHILGPSKINKQTIKKIINSTVAEYVEKKRLKVSQDLQVQQSFEELEAAFFPGQEFSFNASIHLKESNQQNVNLDAST